MYFEQKFRLLVFLFVIDCKKVVISHIIYNSIYKIGKADNYLISKITFGCVHFEQKYTTCYLLGLFDGEVIKANYERL